MKAILLIQQPATRLQLITLKSIAKGLLEKKLGKNRIREKQSGIEETTGEKRVKREKT